MDNEALLVNVENHSSYEGVDSQHPEALDALAQMNIVLLGVPGAGKTTLAHELTAKNEDINYISLGVISRNLPENSFERQELNRLFAIGSPVGVPEFFCGLVEPHIDAAISQGKGFILDGIPKKAEEVEPFLNFLQQKGLAIDMVISCELPTMTAYERVVDRSSRQGDPDTMEIFANRTAKYLEDLDYFKDTLTDGHDKPLVVLHTDEATPSSAAEQVIDFVQSTIQKAHVAEQAQQFASKLYESVQSRNIKEVVGLIGPYFDDKIPGISHSILSGDVLSADAKVSLVQDVLAEQDPSLHDTPLFLKRLAKNYLSTTFMSLEHLSSSLIEEVETRHGESFTTDNVLEVFQQQLGLKKTIEQLQAEVIGDKDLSSLTEAEIAVNSTELSHVEQKLKERALALGIDPRQIDISQLMHIQPRFWGLLTSNQILLSPDYNYRSSSNGKPGSHHSLFPFTNNPRALTATSMGEYVPFIEAVSATEHKYGSTFGFIHFMGMDKMGEAFSAEYPILMQDQRLLDLENEHITSILSKINGIYGNHDLWHNLLPVYADHFILHHPHAPISLGGRLPNYVDFGKRLRQEKEEYEIGVAMSHARTQQERFQEDPELLEEQSGLVLSALDEIGELRESLRETCTAKEIEDIVDHLASKTAKKALNIFRPEDPIFDSIEAKLQSLAIQPHTVAVTDIAKLFWKQGLINRKITSFDGLDDDVVLERLASNTDFASLVLSHLSVTESEKESGAEHIANALASWNLLEKVQETGSVELNGMQKIRWLAIIAPQREQLKGHMEKVHGKPGYMFGDRLIEDSRDLVLLQQEALKKDMQHYTYREYARKANQHLSYKAYSILFDDEQELMKPERVAMTNLRNADDAALRITTKDAVSKLDQLMHDLVTCTYALDEEDLSYIDAYAHMLVQQGAQDTVRLSLALSSLAAEYRELQQNERRYQISLGTSYVEAEQNLLDDQMTLS